MVTEEDRINIVENQIEELIDRQDELSGNSDLLTMFFAEWFDIVAIYEKLTVKNTNMERVILLARKFEEIRPIIKRLGLPFPGTPQEPPGKRIE